MKRSFIPSALGALLLAAGLLSAAAPTAKADLGGDPFAWVDCPTQQAVATALGRDVGALTRDDVASCRYGDDVLFQVRDGSLADKHAAWADLGAPLSPVPELGADAFLIGPPTSEYNFSVPVSAQDHGQMVVEADRPALVRLATLMRQATRWWAGAREAPVSTPLVCPSAEAIGAIVGQQVTKEEEDELCRYLPADASKPGWAVLKDPAFGSVHEYRAWHDIYAESVFDAKTIDLLKVLGPGAFGSTLFPNVGDAGMAVSWQFAPGIVVHALGFEGEDQWREVAAAVLAAQQAASPSATPTATATVTVTATQTTGGQGLPSTGN